MGFGELVKQTFLQPWYDSLRDPPSTQKELLTDLLEGYGRTSYGADRGASGISTIDEFRDRFPRIGYGSLRPYLDETRRGHFSAILPEPPEHWVMTRGSTGNPKVIPVTRTHIQQVRTFGARAIINFAVKHPDSEVLRGKVLNLNFPSRVDVIRVNGQDVSYGYSSGTYAKLIPDLHGTSLIPRQEEIDALGSGIAKRDWHARFELAYEKAKDENVGAIMGVAPVILAFGRYVKRTHGIYPKQTWPMEALFATSVAKIQAKYAPVLWRLFGRIPVVEMYTATEGVYAQQLDELPYVSPNYDGYLLEVEMDGRTKMLCEMGRGDWGRLVVSSCLFPRYEIGDLIECMGKHYFRVFGRDRTRVILEHRLYRLLTRWFI